MFRFGCTPGKVFFDPSPQGEPDFASLRTGSDPYLELDDRTLDVAEVMMGTDGKALLKAAFQRDE